MKRILIVSPVVSHPALSGNSTRIQQMVNALAGLGCEIHFLLCPITLLQDRRQGRAMAEFYRERYHELNHGRTMHGGLLRRAWALALRLGLRKFKTAQDVTITSGIFTAENQSEFRNIVDRIDPDVLLFEYVAMAELADCVGAGRTKIVDTHDRFADRNQRIRAAGGTGTWWSLTKGQERRMLSSFDHALAIQQQEHDLFAQALAGSATRVALVDILDAPARHHQGSTPGNLTIGYVGSNNKHNIEGLFSFIDHHWPRLLEAEPNARLVVAGGIRADRDIQNVSFVGRVDDLWDDLYSQCSIVINPCFSGTGLKIKTVEAMSYGLPVVTSPEGCSGIESAIGQGLFCCDMSSEAFHTTCTMLLRDAATRSQHSLLARQYIEDCVRRSIGTLKSCVR